MARWAAAGRSTTGFKKRPQSDPLSPVLHWAQARMPQFHEEQRFKWFWTAMFCVPAFIVGYGLYREAWLKQPLISGALLWPAFIVCAVVAIWFLRLKLETDVRDDGLLIDFVWLWPRRIIPWDQIRSVETRTYRPIRDFGGGECAGMRVGLSTTRAATAAFAWCWRAANAYCSAPSSRTNWHAP